MNMQVGLCEKSIIRLVGECFVDQYQNENKMESLSIYSHNYVKLVYDNYIVCNPYVLEQALLWTTVCNTPRNKYSNNDTYQKFKKFDRFLRLNKLPSFNSNIIKWIENRYQ
jgi:hypothetical protein